MAAIRGKDTGPEMTVRRLLTAMGYRYRLHSRALPGRPDLVFSSRRAVVFVHGCFWHRHACLHGRVMPRTRRAFWRAKLEGNAVRDKRTRSQLRREGWRVLVVWECQLRDVDKLAAYLRAFLDLA
jgi:DNA mismatch endonuclease (patch repair protein)